MVVFCFFFFFFFLGSFPAYTMAKYGMSMCVLGMAEELKPHGIAVNALWPRTAISTAAMKMLGGESALKQCRKASIMSDAAYAIITRDSRSNTGKFLIDEFVLKECGVSDFSEYAEVLGEPCKSGCPEHCYG